MLCLTFRLRLGLQPSQVVDSTDYRKDCEEFYEPLGFFYISSFRRLCLRIVLDSSPNPEAKIIELRTVKDLSLAERCPAVKIMSLEEALPGIWRWWIHDRTTNGLGFHFGGQMVLVIEIGICTSWRRLTWWSLTRFSLVAVDVQLDLDSSMSSEWVLGVCRLAFDVPASRNKSCLWRNSV